jgi:hypothetical protein
MQKQIAERVRLLGPAVDITALLLGVASPALAGQGNQGNPGILPPQSHPYGKSYGEWSAEHWKWLYSMPIDHHPLFDTAECDEGQSGPVWFLGGTFTPTVEGNVVVGRAERYCTVPLGKALFFPILDSECATLEGNGTTDAELRSCATFFQNHAYNMTCTIDGKPVRNVDSYRVQSPLFTYGPLPENNVLLNSGYPAAVAGATSPSVSDGVFLMVAPLSRGCHTIHFTGALTLSTANGDPFDFDFRLDITYHLTVSDKPDIFPPHSRPYGKSYGEWSAKWWQWAYSLPGTDHPLLDQTGADVATGQSGKVWFLGGTYSAISEGGGLVGRATRVCTVPADKAIFFPILNAEANNFTVDASGNQIAPTTLTEAELRAICEFNMDHARNMTCTIDGWPVKGLEDVLHTHYRVESPLFPYTVPAGDSLYELWGMHISGPTPPPGAVADGVYLMLEPFEAGHHTIYFTGEIFIPGATPAEDFLFRLEIKYIITVPPCHH